MSQIALAPFKRMVRRISPSMRISDPAKREVRRLAEKFAMDILRGAVDISKVAKRKTVMKQDVMLAKKQLAKTV